MLVQALVLALATTSTASEATTAAPIVVPAVLSAGPYRYTFDGTFWNGVKRSLSADELVTRRAGTVDIRVSRDDGPDREATPQERAPYEEIARVFGAGPSAFGVGSRWHTELAVQIGETINETTSVPLDVRVIRTDANGTLVQASGNAHAMQSGGGYRSPVDLTIRVAALVNGGTIVRYDSDTTEDVHAGPFSQQLHWRWSIAKAEREILQPNEQRLPHN